MADIEINDNKSEKDGPCEQEFKFISTGKECSFSFSQLRSKARFGSCVGKHLRSSLQRCKVGNNLDKLEGLLKCTNQVTGRDIEWLDLHLKSTGHTK